MNIMCVEYRGFWTIALMKQQAIVALWSDRKDEWVVGEDVADIAMWAKEKLATDYLNDYRMRLTAAPCVRRVQQVQSAMVPG